jgi:transposase
MIERGPV